MNKHYTPLIIFLIPTIVITIILFLLEENTPSPTLIAGTVILLVAASVTYHLGIRSVLKEKTGA
jgi:hypothetical protein